MRGLLRNQRSRSNRFAMTARHHLTTLAFCLGSLGWILAIVGAIKPDAVTSEVGVWLMVFAAISVITVAAIRLRERRFNMPMDQPPSAYVMPAPSAYSFQNTGPTSIVITRGNGIAPEAMVTISLADGSITYGQNYKPDEAAQAFWKAISSEYGDFLKWKVEHKP